MAKTEKAKVKAETTKAKVKAATAKTPTSKENTPEGAAILNAVIAGKQATKAVTPEMVDKVTAQIECKLAKKKGKGGNFLYELESFNEGKVHAVVAANDDEALKIVIDDLIANKYAEKLKEHEGHDTHFGFPCPYASIDTFREKQTEIYKQRKLRKVTSADEPARLIGRNVDPEKSEMH